MAYHTRDVADRDGDGHAPLGSNLSQSARSVRPPPGLGEISPTFWDPREDNQGVQRSDLQDPHPYL